MPFPPPASSTAIAAPTAQRPASNLPNQYDERSASGTPDTTSEGAALAPPPAAPWAPQPGTEAHKGPSLKEIQEAEAKKAAKQEEAAAAQRRALLEQEAAALREREKVAAAVTVGLPATSTWGTGSPVSATGSAWKQPAAKGTAAGPSGTNTASKKTLADIQREEENRKRKEAQSVAVSGAALGKRYADLASKTSGPPGISNSSPTPQPSTGGGWSTVGAGGKVKIPTGPAAQSRSASASSSAKTPAAPAAARAVATKPATTSLKDAKATAMDEFKKWVFREVSRHVSGVDAEDFTTNLLELGSNDTSLIAEVAYMHSQTLDGRHFAAEFVRRKKLAERGIYDKDASMATDSKDSNNSGWNEVAKKGGSTAPKEDTTLPGFRVVPSKKSKGKKERV